MNTVRWIAAAIGGVAIAAAISPTALSAAEIHSPWLGFDRIRSFLSGGPLQDSNRGREGGSRGGNLCLISPGQGEVVWTMEPLLLLQGNLQSTALYVADSAEPFWSAPIALTDDFVAKLSYDGDPLQPGTTYEQQIQVLRLDFSVVPSRRYAFQIMPAGEERDQIEADLAQLEAELAEAQEDAEAIAIAKAEFFFERDLAADAFQSLFSVDAPSAELVETRQALVKTICEQVLPE
ncbi:hypothetical protein [Nodosilinea sp. E11]|uniref:hypothetical protein n=1 Tax=Nodosilinea sp. E11 TaxID=3037479 RepID=UPI0029345C81|nr:hypothetical protein [Nodosilinea sp. E11]WOD39783.1 hypothetical protein RRF56_03105 [Nodosilinea sp. E11]